MIVVYEKETGKIIRTCTQENSKQKEEIEEGQDYLVLKPSAHVRPTRHKVDINSKEIVDIPKTETEEKVRRAKEKIEKEEKNKRKEKEQELSLIRDLEKRVSALEMKLSEKGVSS